MTIECRDGRYFLAVWFVPVDEQVDVLATAYRDAPEGAWTLLSRIAIQVGVDEREKRWTRAQAPASWSEAKIEETLDQIYKEAAASAGVALEKLLLRSSSAEECSRKLLTMSWAHPQPTAQGGDA